jgi:hypothetical protein
MFISLPANRLWSNRRTAAALRPIAKTGAAIPEKWPVRDAGPILHRAGGSVGMAAMLQPADQQP